MMITNFKHFEEFIDNYHIKLSSVWEVVQGNVYSILAWCVIDFNPNDTFKQSCIVIFDNEHSEYYTLVHDYYNPETEGGEYIDIATNNELDFLDKDAVMKVVNDYMKNFELNQELKKFNI